MKTSSVNRTVSGFGRTDLLAVASSLSLVLVLLFSLGNSTRTATEAVGCQNNLRQLSQAWLKHAADNPLLIGNIANFSGGESDAWATGWMGWTTSSANTNTAYLQTKAFAPYIGTDTTVFRCPADRFVSTVQRDRGWRYRVRSYSMNGYVRPIAATTIDTRYRSFNRPSDFIRPSETFVFTDEHPDSINDPWFGAYPDGSQTADVPASFHNRGSALSFADGHVELHRWSGSRFVRRVYLSNGIAVFHGPDEDLLWLGQRTSQR